MATSVCEMQWTSLATTHECSRGFTSRECPAKFVLHGFLLGAAASADLTAAQELAALEFCMVWHVPYAPVLSCIETFALEDAINNIAMV